MFSCGLYDKYGNFEGTEALANIAIKKGVKTKWRLCMADTVRLILLHSQIFLPLINEFWDGIIS